MGSIMGSGGLVRVELQCGMRECRVGYPGPSMALCAWCVHPRGFVHLPGSIVAGRWGKRDELGVTHVASRIGDGADGCNTAIRMAHRTHRLHW